MGISAEARANVIISAQDLASREIEGLNARIASFAGHVGNAGGVAQSAAGGMGVLGGAMGNIAQIASGILSAALFQRIATDMMGMAKAAFEATAQYERQKVSIEALAARELMRNSVVEKAVVIGQQKVGLNEKEAKQLEDLTGRMSEEIFQRQQLADKIGIEEAALSQLNSAKKINSVAIARKTEEIENLKHRYQNLGTQIDAHQKSIGKLTAESQQYVDVIKKVTSGQMSMADALKQASPRAAELLGWVRQLAIHSPFDRQGITDAFQTAMAYGFVSTEAQKLTGILVDWAAASGKQSYSIGLVTYALGQIRSTGKLLMLDLRQLMNAGIDVAYILGKMGYKLSDVSEGAIDSNKFIEMLSQTMKEEFGGAADRMTNSFDGLRSTIREIAPDLLRAFATPILEKFRVPLANIVEMLTGGKIEVALSKMGASVAAMFEPVDAVVRRLIASTIVLMPHVEKLGGAFMGLIDTVGRLLGFDLSGFDIQSMIIEATTGLIQLVDAAAAFTSWAADSLPGVVSYFQPVINGAKNLAAAFVASSPQIVGALQLMGANVAGVFDRLGPQLISNIGNTLTALGKLWEQHGTTVLAAISIGFNAAVVLVTNTLLILTTVITAALQLLSGDWQGALDTMLSGFILFWENALSLAGTNLEQFNATWTANLDMARIIAEEAFKKIAVFILTTWINIIASVTKFFEDLDKTWKANAEMMRTLGDGLMRWLLEGIIRSTASVIAAVVSAVGRSIAAARELLPMGADVEGRNLRPTSVEDAIIAPGGNVITTDPKDYLIATKNPSELMGGGRGGNVVNVIINVGGSVISEGDLIQNVVNGLRRENILNNGTVLS